jgi:hypothetical protein
LPYSAEHHDHFEDMSKHIDNLREAIEVMHECRAEHRESIRVFEKCGEEEVWGGMVEAFALIGHPKAKFCYAWSFDDNGEPHHMVFLALPGDDSHTKIVPLPRAVSQNTDLTLAI